MMNQYERTFELACPNNDIPVRYHLTIRSRDVLWVEDIVAFTQSLPGTDKPYHENIADAAFARFGGEQELVAEHHGVRITTTRED